MRPPVDLTESALSYLSRDRYCTTRVTDNILGNRRVYTTKARSTHTRSSSKPQAPASYVDVVKMHT